MRKGMVAPATKLANHANIQELIDTEIFQSAKKARVNM